MTKMGFTGTKWTDEELISIAKGDGSRSVMAKLHHGAYRAAIRRDLLDSIYPSIGPYPEYVLTKTHKSCSDCKKIKQLKAFHNDASSKNGKMSHCKSCKKDYEKEHKVKPKIKKHRQDREFKRGLFRNYGITVDQYQKMFNNQKGNCGICSKNQKVLTRRLAVDHNHGTGHIRGLLCDGCNPGIGYFKDSIKLLQNAIEYLKRTT